MSSVSGSSSGKRFAKVIAIVAAGAIIATFSTVYALDQINRYGEVPCPKETDVSSGGNKGAENMIGFTTLEEIVSNADAIVVAEVEECVKVHSHPKAKEIRLADFDVTVERIVKGDLHVGSSVTVQLLTSGLDADAHVMKTGERYVLFLTYNQITSGYSPVGGPQGRFPINDDRVYSMDAIHSDLSFITVRVDGQPLDDFLSKVQSIS